VNYYERHLGDYCRDTMHLSALEHGIYNLLIDRYYVTERPIPDVDAHRIARSSRDDTLSVLRDFFTLDGDVWTHKRIDAEIQRFQEHISKQRANGKLGGRPRKEPKENPPLSSGFLLGNPNETQPKALQTPDSRLQLKSKDDFLPEIVSTPSAAETDLPDPGDDEPEEDLLGVVPPPRRKRETPACPGQKIADLWDQILLPEAASISQWNDRRARVVGARWKEQAEVEGWQTQADGLAWFETIFRACRNSKFLMGKVPARPGQLQFKLKFDWFFGAENFIRIIEGDFHRGR